MRLRDPILHKGSWAMLMGRDLLITCYSLTPCERVRPSLCLKHGLIISICRWIVILGSKYLTNDTGAAVSSFKTQGGFSIPLTSGLSQIDCLNLNSIAGSSPSVMVTILRQQQYIYFTFTLLKAFPLRKRSLVFLKGQN